MCTDVNAYDCTGWCRNTERESALKVDSGKKISCRTRESNLRQRHDGPMLEPTELHPNRFTLHDLLDVPNNPTKFKLNWIRK